MRVAGVAADYENYDLYRIGKNFLKWGKFRSIQQSIDKFVTRQPYSKKIIKSEIDFEFTLRRAARQLAPAIGKDFMNMEAFVTAMEMGLPTDILLRDEYRGTVAKLGRFCLTYARTLYTIVLFLGITPEMLLNCEFPEEWYERIMESAAYSRGWDKYRINFLRANDFAPGMLDPAGTAERLLAARTSGRKSRQALAETVGINRNTVLNYETKASEGETQPQRFSYPLLVKICQCIGADPDHIMLGVSAEEVIEGLKTQSGIPESAVSPERSCLDRKRETDENESGGSSFFQPAEKPAENIEKNKDPESDAAKMIRQQSALIRRLLLSLSDGRCENCGNEAPFRDKEGLPYLQLHYITPLAAGGRIDIDNIALVCPNCNARLGMIGYKGEDEKAAMEKRAAERAALLLKSLTSALE